MSKVATKKNEILASQGFTENMERPLIPYGVGDEVGLSDVENFYPNKSIPLDKLKFSLYDAVVDQQGSGTHLTIQNAINDVNASGGGSVLLKNGTYILNDDITLYSNISLIGEDKYNTIIDGNQSVSNYKIDCSGSSPYSTGTISVTVNDATVTGDGTTWSSNLSSGDLIIIESGIYEISEVTDDTHIELDILFKGQTSSGLSYYAGNFNRNINIENLSLINFDPPSSGLINFYYIVNSKINSLYFKDNSYDSILIYQDESFNCDFSDIEIYNAQVSALIKNSKYNRYSNITSNNMWSIGIRIETSSYNFFFNIKINNSYSDGFSILESSYNIIVNSMFFNCNYGIYISNSSYNIISNCNIINSTTGLVIAGQPSNANYNTISNSNIISSHHNGIRIISGAYNKIQNNVIKDSSQKTNNTYDDISLEAISTPYTSYNIITGNLIRATGSNKSKYGIWEGSNEDYNIITNNIVQGAVTANISTQGANTIKDNNIE